MTTNLPSGNASSPALLAFAVTPSNTVDLAQVTRGIYVGVSGDLKVDMVAGGTVIFVDLAAGMIHPIAAKRIYQTGTDATSIIGLY